MLIEQFKVFRLDKKLKPVKFDIRLMEMSRWVSVIGISMGVADKLRALQSNIVTLYSLHGVVWLLTVIDGIDGETDVHDAGGTTDNMYIVTAATKISVETAILNSI